MRRGCCSLLAAPAAAAVAMRSPPRPRSPRACTPRTHTRTHTLAPPPLPRSAWLEGRPIPRVEELARKYGADEGVLREALAHHALPLWTRDARGELVGVWPTGLPAPGEEEGAAAPPPEVAAVAGEQRRLHAEFVRALRQQAREEEPAMGPGQL